MHYTLLMASFLVLLSCQSTDKVTRIDKEKRKVEIQSQTDVDSAVNFLIKDGLLDQTQASLLELSKENPTKIATLLNISQVSLAQGDLKKAEDFCRKALRLDLKNQDAKLILANIYYRNGNFDMAEIIINGLEDSYKQSSRALNIKALISLKQDRKADALAIFKEALKKDPGDVAVRMNLGVLHLDHQQVDNAAVEFERVLKIMPDHPDAKMHLAMIYSIRKEYDAAERLFDEVGNLNSKNALYLYNMAILEERRENFDSSLDYLDRYLSTVTARSKNNQEVFAMIDRIKTRKAAMGESISDEQIKTLAAKAIQRPKTSKKKPYGPTVDSVNTKVHKERNDEARPKAADSKKSFAGEDVEDLERMLK